MALVEGFNVMNTRNIEKRRTINAWSSGTIIECPMIAEDCYDVLERTVEDARVFVMFCTSCGIPCPAVQAALTQYDFIHQRKTSISFLMAQRNHFGQHSIIEK
jgi:6-phosphogluconate dehydrogenase